MNRSLRWRILSLQAALVVILGFAAGVAFWASNYVQSQVSTQLTAQEISFPAANSAEITALPAADATAMRQYAGQKLTTGPQAEVWANDFIRIHLSSMPTYEQASAAARANPTSAKDAATLNTVFTGTMLRGTLLNAYGWWSVGTYTFYAAIGLTIAAIAVLGALAFELVLWRRQANAPEATAIPVPAGSALAPVADAVVGIPRAAVTVPAGDGVAQLTEQKS